MGVLAVPNITISHIFKIEVSNRSHMHMFILGKYISIKFISVMFVNVNYHNFLKEFLLLTQLAPAMGFKQQCSRKGVVVTELQKRRSDGAPKEE